METNNNNEAKAEKQTPDSSGEGSVGETTSLLDRGYTIAERLEKANKEAKEILARQEALYTKQILSGKAEAGKPVVEKTQQEKDREEAKAIVDKYLRHK